MGSKEEKVGYNQVYGQGKFRVNPDDERVVWIENRLKITENKEPINPNPFIFPMYFENGEYEHYEALARNLRERLLIKRRNSGLGSNWNRLGIDIEDTYYERDVLVIEPVVNQDIDFGNHSFINIFRKHLDIYLEELDVEKRFKIFYVTENKNKRKPIVYVDFDSLEGKAFLSAYQIGLRQDEKIVSINDLVSLQT